MTDTMKKILVAVAILVLVAITGTVYADATVTVTSTAPNLIKDGCSDDCLKIVVENQDSGADGTITWQRFDTRITADGDVSHQIDYDKIFGWIRLYKDANGDQSFDISDTQLKSIIPTSGTVTFEGISNGTISPSGSATYFVVVELKDDASLAGSRTFVLTADENGTSAGSAALSNYWTNESGGMVTLDHTDPDEVSSTVVNITPDAYISLAGNSGSPNVIDEERLWFLRVTVDREAYDGENVEFASLTVKLTPASEGTYSLTQAQAIFSQLLVYRSIDGNWDDTDPVCGTKTGSEITLSDQGTITIGLDGSAIIASQTTRYYFFVVKTTGTASGQGSRTFNSQINPQTDVCLRDNETKVTFPHEYGVFSPIVQARPIPKTPEATAISTAPDTIGNSEIACLLRIKITHTGTIGAGAIELNQATITFTASDTTTLMSTQDAKAFFETVYLIKDNGDGLYTIADTTIVGSCTNADLSLTDGKLTLNMGSDLGTTTGGTYTYYFLAIKMKSDASSYGTTTFTAAIDPDTLRIVDMKDDILLSPLPAQDTVTTGLIRAVAAPPNIFAIDTSALTIIDGTEDDLIRIDVGNTAGGTITLGSVTVGFNLNPGNLFSKLYIYAGGIRVGTTSPSAAQIQIISLDNSNLTRIGPSSTNTYFFVVELQPDASVQSPDTFYATVTDVLVRDTPSGIILGTASNLPVYCGPVKCIGTNATVTVTDSAPVPAKMTEDEQEDILMIKVRNNNTLSAGTITFSTLTLTLTSNGVTPITSSIAQALFGSLTVWHSIDGTWTTGDTPVATLTSILSSAGTISISINGTISPNATNTYFVVISATSTIGSFSPNTFDIAVDGDADCLITEDGVRLGVYPTTPVRSTNVEIQGKPANPNIFVADTTPAGAVYQMKDGSIDDLLSIKLAHTGDSRDASIEFADLTINFKDKNGNPLTPASGTALFSEIRLYLDNGDNGFSVADDTMIYSASPSVITGGSQTINLVDGDANCWVSPQSTKTYFVVVKLTGTAHAAIPNTFTVTAGSDTCVIEDANTDVALVTTGNSATTKKIEAITGEPEAKVYDTAPAKLNNYGLDDILMLSVTHQGQPAGTSIRVGSITLLISDGVSTITSGSATEIFSNVFVYESTDAIFSTITDTIKGTANLSGLSNGTITINLIASNNIDTGTTKYYFAVASIRGTATNSNLNSFAFTIDGDTTYIIKTSDGSYVSPQATEPVTSTTVLLVLKNPTVVVSDTAPTTMTELEAEDILKFITYHNDTETAVARIRLGSVTVHFNNAVDSLIDMVYICTSTDQVFDGTLTDQIVGTVTAPTGVNVVIALVSGSETSPAGSSTYFIVVRAKQGAAPGSFTMAIDPDTDCSFYDATENGSLTVNPTGTTTPKVTTIQAPALPLQITITDMTSAYSFGPPPPIGEGAIEDGSVSTMLKAVVSYLVEGTRTDVSMTMLSVWFGSGTTSLTQGEVQALFSNLWVYRGSTIIASTSTPTINNGTLTFTFSPGSQTFNPGSTNTYYIVVQMKSNASVQPQNKFQLSMGTGSFLFKDNNTDGTVSQTSNGTETRMMTAIPLPPIVEVIDSSPYIPGTAYYQMTDNQEEIEDLLRIELANTATTGADSVQLATVTVRMTHSGGDGVISGAEAKNLFANAYLYRSSDNTTFEPGDDLIKVIGSTSFTGGTWTDQGTLTFSLTEAEKALCRVAPQNTGYFFLVFDLAEGAATATPNNFRATIDEQSSLKWIVVEGSGTSIPLRHTNTGINPVSSQFIYAKDRPPAPNVTVTKVNQTLSDTANNPGYLIKDSVEDVIFSVDVANLGAVGTSAYIEWDSMRLRFTYDGTVTISEGTLTAMITNIYVRRNGTTIINPGGVYTYNSNGTVTVAGFNDGGNSIIAPGGTETFEVRVVLRNRASGIEDFLTFGTRTFCVDVADGHYNTYNTGFQFEDANIEDTLPNEDITSIADYSGTTTSNNIECIPVNPSVAPSDTAPGSSGHPDPPTVTDDEKEDLLTIGVRNNGVANAGYIEFASVTVRLMGSGTAVAPLTQTDCTNLFKELYIIRDNGDGSYASNDTATVGSLTDFSSINDGYLLFNLRNKEMNYKGTANTLITYFFVVEMTTNAHAYATRTFRATIDGDQSQIEDWRKNDVDTHDVKLGMSSTSPVNSTLVTVEEPVRKDAAVRISDYPAPAYLKDTYQDNILKIEIGNPGQPTDSTIEFSTLTLRLWALADDYTGTQAMTQSQAQAIFENIYIVAATSTQPIIGSITGSSNIIITNGTLSIGFRHNDKNTWIEPLGYALAPADCGVFIGTGTYLAIFDLRGTASGQGSRTFRASCLVNEGGSQTDVYLDDPNTEDVVNVAKAGTSTSGTSSPTKAIPIDPQVTVTNTAPDRLTEGGKDDLLKIDVNHKGLSGAGEIELATITVKFTNGTYALSTQDLTNLVSTLTICYDTINNPIATFTDFSLTNGTQAFTIPESIYSTITAGATNTYYLVVELRGTASGYGTHTLRAIIDTWPTLEDDRNDIWLGSGTPTNVGTLVAGTSTMVTILPPAPWLIATDTAPSTIKDTEEGTLTKIIVYHTGSATSGSVTFNSLMLDFNLTDAQCANLFGTISLYESGLRVATETNILGLLDGNGIGTLTVSNGTISPSGSKTYFLAVQLLSTASGQSPKQWRVEVGSTSATFKADGFDLGEDVSSTGTISGSCTAIPLDPSVTITNSSVATQTDGTIDDLLKIVVSNLYAQGAGSVTLSTLTATFYAMTSTTDGTTTMSDSLADRLFGSITVYRDTGDGVYGPGDILVTSLTSFNLSSQGTISIGFGVNNTISANGTVCFFLAVSLWGTSSGMATRTYLAHIGTISVVIQESTGIWLSLHSSSFPGTSSPVTAVPKPPSLAFYDSVEVSDSYPGESPYPAPMSSGDEEDLLRFTIDHNGTTGAGSVELATLTTRFSLCQIDNSGGVSGTTTMNSDTATTLFDWIGVYRDTAEPFGTFTNNDTRIGSITNFTGYFTDGTVSITMIISHGSASVSGGTSATFFITVKLKPGAYLASPRHFMASVDRADFIVAEATADDILLSTTLTPSATSTRATAQVAPLPPTFRVTGIAPSMVRDGTWSTFLKMELVHNGTQNLAPNIEFASLTLLFSMADGSVMKPASATALFDGMEIWWDEGNDGSMDVRVATSTLALSDQGTQAIGFTDGRKITQVHCNSGKSNYGTKTYFLKLKMKPAASNVSFSRNFRVSVPGTDATWTRIENASNDNLLSLKEDSTAATTTTWAVLEDPAVWIDTDYPGTTLIDGHRASILRLDVCHIGAGGSQPGEFSTLTVTFYAGTPGATSLGSMTNAQAQALFSTITLYYDDNEDKQFNYGQDPEVASLTSFSLSQYGTMTITLPESDPNNVPGSYTLLVPGGNATKTYFWVSFLRGTASSYGTKTFQASIYEGTSTLRPWADVYCESAWDNIGPLPLTAVSGEANNPRFSGSITAIAATPTVKVYDVATSSYIFQGSWTVKDWALAVPLLRMDVINEGLATAGSITLNSLRTWFGSDTIQVLTTDQLAEIFGTISLYLDDGDDIWETTDTRATHTISLTLVSGIGTFNLTSNNEIPAAGSLSYFLVVDMKPDASATWTKTFVGSISTRAGDAYPHIVDTGSNIRYATFTSQSFGSNSTRLHIIPVNPTVTVSDYVPYTSGTYTYNNNVYLRDGSETAILKIDVKHNGTPTAIPIEFGSISVYFTDTTQLSAGSMTGLFEYVAVYRDTGNMIGSIGSTIAFQDYGTQTFNLYGSNTATNWIAGSQTGTFYLKVKLKPSASGSATRTFKATLVGTTGCTIRDAVSKIILEHVNSTGSESTKITAIPVNPSLTAISDAPEDKMARDGTWTSLLKLTLWHTGSSSSRLIEFATITAKFYELTPQGAGTITMSSATANNLFDTIYLYAGTFTSSGVELGSVTFGVNGTLS
ncbi:MAG: hypothetical protein V2A53_01120, partial [bacterium]